MHQERVKEQWNAPCEIFNPLLVRSAESHEMSLMMSPPARHPGPKER
jgi:hypothetical protein